VPFLHRNACQQTPTLHQTLPVPRTHPQAVAIMVLLASLVGKYCLPGVGILCLVVPAQYYFGYRIIKNKVANFPNTNARYSIIQVRGMPMYAVSLLKRLAQAVQAAFEPRWTTKLPLEKLLTSGPT
jgi:hypothetical protein